MNFGPDVTRKFLQERIPFRGTGFMGFRGVGV